MASLLKNVASQNITFTLVSATTGAALTSATFTSLAWVTKDNTQAGFAGTFTTLGNGQYNYAPTQAETNCTDFGLLVTVSGAIPVNLDFHTDLATPLTGAQIATAVWTDTTAGDFTTALSVGKSVMNGVALGTGLTINGYTGNTPQTGDSYARIGAAGAGLTAITGVTLAASQPGVTIPTVTTVTNQLTAAAIATGVWQDSTSGDFTAASSIGKSLGGAFTALGTSVYSTASLVNAPTGGSAPTVAQVATASGRIRRPAISRSRRRLERACSLQAPFLARLADCSSRVATQLRPSILPAICRGLSGRSPAMLAVTWSAVPPVLRARSGRSPGLRSRRTSRLSRSTVPAMSPSRPTSSRA